MTDTTPAVHHSNPEAGNYIHASKYARFRDDKGRREIWSESVDRYLDHLGKHIRRKFPDGSGSHTLDELIPQSFPDLLDNVHNQDVMPSMRALATAGPALDRDNTAGYNCAYLVLKDIRSFAEVLYILMCGTGVGFSVESRYVSQLPSVPEDLGPPPNDDDDDDDFTWENNLPIIVDDSKQGWAFAVFDWLWDALIMGVDRYVDTSQLRPAGSPLRTFGGRASGPGPLNDAVKNIRDILYERAGQQLRPIDAHDMACHIAQSVISGGVRRAAMISLSDLDDAEMRDCKTGEWWKNNPQRALANNSAAIENGISWGEFSNEWEHMVESMAGERGLFSRDAAREKAKAVGRDPNVEYGCNPCSEILLRPFQFCNLTEIVARPEDTQLDLSRKGESAAVLGTLQSTLDYFPFIRREFNENAEEERLLGVSITGICDHKTLSGQNGYDNLQRALNALRLSVYNANWTIAHALDITPSKAMTCVKPSGTVANLVDSAPGIHPRYASHYYRTFREDKMSPVADFLIDQGFYCEEDQMDTSNWIFYFPMASPENALTADTLMGIHQLYLWIAYNRHWADHKPSMTCYLPTWDSFAMSQIKETVWSHINEISGIAFLPYDGHIYSQAPMIPISKQEYFEASTEEPKNIDWTLLGNYESEDNTTQAQEFACAAGGCTV